MLRPLTSLNSAARSALRRTYFGPVGSKPATSPIRSPPPPRAFPLGSGRFEEKTRFPGIRRAERVECPGSLPLEDRRRRRHTGRAEMATTERELQRVNTPDMPPSLTLGKHSGEPCGARNLERVSRWVGVALRYAGTVGACLGLASQSAPSLKWPECGHIIAAQARRGMLVGDPIRSARGLP